MQFASDNGCAPGGPDVSLTYPKTTQRIVGDGNCLYRALVYAITGSQSQHHRLRCLLVQHLRSLVGTEQEQRLLGNLLANHNTIEDYILHSKMDQRGSWGSEVEMALLAHKLGINIASFNAPVGDYAVWSAGYFSPNQYGEDNSRPTIYLFFTGDHFNVVLSQE